MSQLQKTRDRVQNILTDKLGSVQIDRDGNIKLEYESTMISVTMTEEKQWTYVSFTSPIAIGSDTRKASEIYEWCNRMNIILDFGAVVHSLDPDRPENNYTVIKHTLLGNFLDPDELMSSLFAIIHAANDVDELFVSEFGGKRYTDT